MHEAGHAAHFANIKMPSPLFSQERAPTSVAYAELQSMFLDALVGDAAWRCKYATSREGKSLPWELIVEDCESKHPYEVFMLRAMLAVPYFEKASALTVPTLHPPALSLLLPPCPLPASYLLPSRPHAPASSLPTSYRRPIVHTRCPISPRRCTRCPRAI